MACWRFLRILAPSVLLWEVACVCLIGNVLWQPKLGCCTPRVQCPGVLPCQRSVLTSFAFIAELQSPPVSVESVVVLTQLVYWRPWVDCKASFCTSAFHDSPLEFLGMDSWQWLWDHPRVPPPCLHDPLVLLVVYPPLGSRTMEIVPRLAGIRRSRNT